MLIILTYLGFFLWLLRVLPFVRNSGLPLNWVSVAFLLKCLAGTALWAIYTYYYHDRSSADIFKYYDDAMIMFGALQESPLDYLKMLTGIANDSSSLSVKYYSVMNNWFREWETSFYNDTHTIIRWNAVVRLFSFGQFHVHTLFMSFFSLLGCVALYRAFINYCSTYKKGLFFSCALLPSVLLWTSAPTKEGLLITGLGFLLFAFTRIMETRISGKMLIILLLSAGLIFLQKFYVLASMLPALFIAYWHGRSDRLHWGLKSAIALGLTLGLVTLLEWLGPGYEIMGRLAKKQEDFINHGLATGANSMIPLMPLDGSIWGFIKSIPHAFGLTLFGPGAYWRGGILGVIANLENLFVILMLTGALFLRKRELKTPMPMILLICGSVFVLFTLIGWTTPVLGAMVRYRLPGLPLILVLSLILVDSQRMHRAIPKFHKLIQ